MQKNYGIILASGNGNRFGTEIPKQFMKIARKTVLEHTIEIFENAPEIDKIIVVITPEYRHMAEEILSRNKYLKIACMPNGGQTRKDSSLIGINSIDEEEANVLIHDCARPFLTQRIITDCVRALDKYEAIDVAIPATDTIIETNDDFITNIPNRAKSKFGQTPQCFKLSLIKKAHELAKDDNNFTDDCGLVVKYGLSEVFVVDGDVDNIKITYPSDVFLAEKIFEKREQNKKTA